MNKLSVLIPLLMCSGTVEAGDNVMFKGALSAPPVCTINSGAATEINFGSRVGVSKVDGVNYRQKVNYQIGCSGDTTGWDTTLTLIGVRTDNDAAALKTTMADLGIRFIQGGKPMSINQPILIDPRSPPVLEAVPVKKQGAKLAEGAFSATANLQIQYQ